MKANTLNLKRGENVSTYVNWKNKNEYTSNSSENVDFL